MKTTTRRTALFGPYALDLRSGELRKFGTRVKIGEQAFQILLMLLETQGELVTREELRAKLWAGDTFVDFDHGLNSAVQRLRGCLSDSAEKPRWVETVPRRGYRFIGEVDWSDEGLPSEVLPKPSNGSPEEMSEGAIQTSVTRESSQEPDRTISSSRRISLLAAAALLLFLATVAIVKRFQQAPSANPALPIRSIAVLPLENLSGDPTQDYFADGITDELITALAKNRSLRVVSRTSTMQYKGVKRPVGDIARELRVDGILEGSITRSGDRVHMTVQLIYAPTDTHIWAESYDRDLNQAYSLPEELSQIVAKEVKIATSPTAPPRYINPEAHDAYLRGRYFWFAKDIRRALPNFEKAIQLQPDYAAAWSGLANTYMLAGMGWRPPLEMMAKAQEAARKSVEFDNLLPEAHNAMAAWYLFYGWDLLHADAECRRAIELDPNYPEVHYLRSFVLLAMQRDDEAEAEEKRYVELDPYTRLRSLGAFYVQTRQFDAAINELRMQNQVYPYDAGVVLNLSKAYWLKGMYQDSQRELERFFQLRRMPESEAAFHRAWLKGGEKAVEQWRVEDDKANARKGYVSAIDLAIDFAMAGEKEETLKYLEEAYREHCPDLISMRNEPFFDFVHTQPRYQALIKKIGLSPAP